MRAIQEVNPLSYPLPDDPNREASKTALEAVYDWAYGDTVEPVQALYRKALDQQWVAYRRLDWEAPVDEELLTRSCMMGGIPIEVTSFWASLPEETRAEVARRSTVFTLSNFLHGEQGAMFVASQLVNAVPELDGKFYAATQSVDEARHVEVFRAYIRRLGEIEPIAPPLKRILDAILEAEDWRQKAIGMNIILEGLALFGFRTLRNGAHDPLLKEILTLVSQDEARHTAFGLLYLERALEAEDETELGRLEDYAFETARWLLKARAGLSMREASFDLWKSVGVEPADVEQALRNERDALRAERQRRNVRGEALGSFVLPMLDKIGLLSDRLRGHFDDLFRETSHRNRGLDGRIHELPDDLEAWVLDEGETVAGAAR